MDLREKRVEDFLISQLFPINIIDENKLKRLGVSLSLYKICKNFPLDQIGNFKKLQKEFEKNKVSNFLFNKEFKDLSVEEVIETRKVLNKRAQNSMRTSNYTKFLVRSILQTYDNTKVSSFKEEVYENWIFEKDGVKKDITLNKENLFKENCIYLDPAMIFDENQILKEDFVIKIMETLQVDIKDYDKVREINNCFNKVISNHKMLYVREEISESKVLIKRDSL